MLPTSIQSSSRYRVIDTYYKFLFAYFALVFFLTLLLIFLLYPVLYDLFVKELDFQAHQMNVCTHPLSIKHSSRLSLKCDNLGAYSFIGIVHAVISELFMRVPSYVGYLAYFLAVSWVFALVNFMMFFIVA